MKGTVDHLAQIIFDARAAGWEPVEIELDAESRRRLLADLEPSDLEHGIWQELVKARATFMSIRIGISQFNHLRVRRSDGREQRTPISFGLDPASRPPRTG